MFIGVVVTLFGPAPRLGALTWALVSWALFAAVFGVLLELPQWAMDLSPVEAGPRVPYEQLSVAPLLVLGGLAVALVVAGFLGFRRRDLG